MEVSNLISLENTNISFSNGNTVTNVSSYNFYMFIEDELTPLSFNTNLGIYTVFVDNDFSFFDKFLRLKFGLRSSYFDIINQFSFEPRETIYFDFKNYGYIFLSSGYVNQFITDPKFLYLLKVEKFKVPGVIHLYAGYNLDFFDSYSFGVEGYFKDYVNMPSLAIYYEKLCAFWEFDNTKRNVYGVEIKFSKKKDILPLYGWISFSHYQIWNYNEKEIPFNVIYFKEFEHPVASLIEFYSGINDFTAGDSVQPPVKKWHRGGGREYNLNTTTIWDINKNLSITAEFILKSGKYYTPVVGSIKTTNNSYKPVYGELNSEKLPDWHMQNIKVDYQFKLFGLPCGLYVQIFNIYNNKVVTRYAYNEDFTGKYPVYSDFGILGHGSLWIKVVEKLYLFINPISLTIKI